MYSDLVDDRGRKRAGIFYKTAFYDRNAHISLAARYHSGTQSVGGHHTGASIDERCYEGFLKDGKEIIFRTSPTESEPKISYDDNELRKKWLKWVDARDAKRSEAEAWLQAKFPDYREPLAYWD